MLLFRKVQKESEAATAALQERMQVAAQEVSSTSVRLQQEVEARKQLEETVGALKQQVAAEKAQAVEAGQHEWEVRKKELLEGIQRECNSLFERSLSTTGFTNARTTARPSLGSPIAATQPYLLQQKVSFDFDEILAAPSPALNSSMVSTPSQIDRALEETEAIILSLVGTSDL